MRTIPDELKARARNLRRDQTVAEEFLWQRLRNRGVGGFKFRRQKPFPPYIVDFYCAEKNFAIEVDGGQHADHAAEIYDRQRTEFLEAQGVKVLRYWNNQVCDEIEWVLEDIWNHLNDGSSAP